MPNLDRFFLPFEPQEVGECGSCQATIYDGDEFEEYSTRLLCVNCEAEKTELEEKEIDIHAYIEDHVKYFDDTPDIETIKHQFNLYTENEPMIENILKQYDGITI